LSQLVVDYIAVRDLDNRVHAEKKHRVIRTFLIHSLFRSCVYYLGNCQSMLTSVWLHFLFDNFPYNRPSPFHSLILSDAEVMMKPLQDFLLTLIKLSTLSVPALGSTLAPLLRFSVLMRQVLRLLT
jgi:hypothetical protein